MKKVAAQGEKHKEQLQKAGLRVTRGRTMLLSALANERFPLSINSIQKRMRPTPDKVTLYRSLEALVEAGIVARVDLGHAHTHYELVEGRTHHHHLVCQKCDRVEDVHGCPVNHIERDALKKSKAFASIQSHALELFGVCTACAQHRP